MVILSRKQRLFVVLGAFQLSWRIRTNLCIFRTGEIRRYLHCVFGVLGLIKYRICITARNYSDI